ncbi:MFS transporter [Bradyrhizobium cenepequi]|uniref:MFS transporter n=1 Tax=Bradyrhizobium cenepequi TaxID=2821403 RepID=UPI001CE3A2B9|nr:MFS transporter [Bradyrhizobium cenepequi]MCA6108028.1 MFS transporter [Bradyrhizobium cenepequi]
MNCLSLVKTFPRAGWRNLGANRREAWALRIHPDSSAFTLLLGLMASLPTFAIDTILPSLSATGDDLQATSVEVGLAMSVYLMSLGATPLAYGPISDRIGRKPIVLFGCVLVVIASFGCMLCISLPQFLIFRALEGAGASASAIAAFAIVGDIFDGEAAAAKMANVVLAIYIVPMIAPTIGAALLALSSWRAIYLVPIAGGLVLLMAMSDFSESARIDPNVRLSPAPIVRNYLRILRHPVCVGNILCNAAAAGAMFAYFTGSSLFFINALGLNPYEYGVIFGASSLSVMAGTRGSRKLSGWGLSPAQVITAGLALSTIVATSLLLMALVGGKSAVVVVLVMVGVALSFGFISPHAMNEALQQIAEIVGSISAARAFVQMIGAASSRATVAALFDGHSVFSMAVVMFAFCLLSVAAYAGIVLPAEG